MGELKPGDSSLAADEARDPGERLRMLINPDPKIAGRNSAVSSNSGGFDDNESDAADRTTAEMNEMPVVGETFFGRILAHR